MSNTPFPLGAYLGNPNGSDASSEATFESYYSQFSSVMGTAPSLIVAYVDQTQAISNWVSNASWQAWSNAQSPDAKNLTPVIGLPMTSTAAGALTADQYYKNFAAGDYDSMIQGVVKAWSDQGFKTQYWRPGWEMNLPGMPSYGGTDAATQADWIKAFQHIYTVLHAAGTADGVNVQVVWNPSITNGATVEATNSLYPGNNYVDVIGADVYSDLHPYGNTSALYDWDKSGQTLNSKSPVYDSSLQQWASDPVNLQHYYTDPAATQWSLDGSNGHSLSLQNLLDFAKAQGKPVGIGEAGAGTTNDGAGVSDNPTFVKWLHDTLENSGVAIKFVDIWDSNGGGNYAFSSSSDNKPQEAAAWGKYFGAQASTTPTPTPTPTPVPGPVTIGSGPDTVMLHLSEDAWQGNAQVSISVDGKAVGGVQTITASHALGQDQTLNVDGSWGAGTHSVTVDFLNDAYGGSGSTDRNAYVDSTSYDGVAAAHGTASLLNGGPVNLTVGTAIPAVPTIPAVTVGSGADTLDLKVSEDAYLGNAQFTVTVDGKQVGGTLTSVAIHGGGQTQDFYVDGNFGSGPHRVGVDFLNDAWGGSASTDRNLYVTGASFDGKAQSGVSLSLQKPGTQFFTTAAAGASSASVASATTYNEGSGGGTVTAAGNDIVQMGSGAVTVNAAGSSVNVIGSSGDLQFLAGSGNATIAAGSGASMIDIVNGSAGGSLTISGFASGTDAIHLQGYAGSGIRTETVSGGSTQIVLTDNTSITLTGFSADASHPVFG